MDDAQSEVAGQMEDVDETQARSEQVIMLSLTHIEALRRVREAKLGQAFRQDVGYVARAKQQVATLGKRFQRVSYTPCVHSCLMQPQPALCCISHSSCTN